jgi:hypothetical protein
MQTNYNLPIYRKTKNWKGEITSSLIDYYDVWIEFGTVYKYTQINGLIVKSQGSMAQQEVGKGWVIMEEELDLTGCYIVYNDVEYEVNAPEVFYDRRGNFHHMEFTFI